MGGLFGLFCERLVYTFFSIPDTWNVFFLYKVSNEAMFPFRKDPEKLKVFYLFQAFTF